MCVCALCIYTPHYHSEVLPFLGHFASTGHCPCRTCPFTGFTGSGVNGAKRCSRSTRGTLMDQRCFDGIYPTLIKHGYYGVLLLCYYGYYDVITCVIMGCIMVCYDVILFLWIKIWLTWGLRRHLRLHNFITCASTSLRDEKHEAQAMCRPNRTV